MFRPSGADCECSSVPTACAVGYILSPLRGCNREQTTNLTSGAPMTSRTRTRMNRRRFLQTAAAAGVGYFVASRSSMSRGAVSPNEKLNVAHIGTNNQAAYDLREVSRCENANIVALCDVDEKLLGV